jgi:peroxidase
MQAGGEYYAVPTGRRDSRVSLASSVNLPGPGLSMASAASAFQGRGLNITDMVTLLGAHTMGVAHCEFFYNRLYNFSGTGRQDPSMAPSLVESLKSICPEASAGLGNTNSAGPRHRVRLRQELLQAVGEEPWHPTDRPRAHSRPHNV